MTIVRAPSSDIVAYVSENPVTVLTDEAIYSQFYERVKAELAGHVPDLATEKGRKEIASLAYKVTRSKTAIDAAGKKLNEDARAQINKVDAQRRRIRDELDALAADVRKPLTEWEEAEKKRAETVAGVFAAIETAATVTVDDTSETIAARLARLDTIEIDDADFGDRVAEANNAVYAAWRVLTDAKARLEKQEADAAELARLRAAQEERDRQEREKAEADRREAERKRIEEEAAERARLEERRRAQEEIDKARAEKQAAIAEAERREQERQAAEDRARREAEARAADLAHRETVMTAAADAIAALGVDREDARGIVAAIAAGDIPNVMIGF